MAKARTNATQYTALYERLSWDDEQQGESNSITNQKYFLEDYAKKNGFTRTKHFSDDGYNVAIPYGYIHDPTDRQQSTR